MNGVEDHIHIITHLHPTIALSSLVKDIKVSSSKYIKDKKLFQHFFGWQTGYAAFTYSIDAKDTLIYYVKNQESHHKKLSYKDELVSLLEEHKIPYDNKYLE
jgi:REP element-mobilizing transposase RayT